VRRRTITRGLWLDAARLRDVWEATKRNQGGDHHDGSLPRPLEESFTK
jgi:hypothetical protein